MTEQHIPVPWSEVALRAPVDDLHGNWRLDPGAEHCFTCTLPNPKCDGMDPGCAWAASGRFDQEGVRRRNRDYHRRKYARRQQARESSIVVDRETRALSRLMAQLKLPGVE